MNKQKKNAASIRKLLYALPCVAVICAIQGPRWLEATEKVIVSQGQVLDLTNRSGNSVKIGSLSGKGVLVFDEQTLVIDADTPGIFHGEIFGKGALEKTGPATLHLYGVNDYTGPTVIHEGAIAIYSVYGLGNLDEPLVLKGSSLHIEQEINRFDKPIHLDGFGRLKNNLVAVGISADISGDDLMKAGKESLALLGPKSYTGRTIVERGQIAIDHPLSLGTSNTPVLFKGDCGIETLAQFHEFHRAIEIESQSKFTFTADEDVSMMQDIRGGANVEICKKGLGALSLEALTIRSGSLHVADGSLIYGAKADLNPYSSVRVDGELNIARAEHTCLIHQLDGSGKVVFGKEGLVLNQTDNRVFSGLLCGEGSLSKTSNGALTLTKAQPYIGPTQILEGTLVLQEEAMLENSSAVCVQAKLDLRPSAKSQVLRNLSGSGEIVMGKKDLIVDVDHASEFKGKITALDNGALIKRGAGRWSLKSNNDYKGSTHIEAGSLSITSLGALGETDKICFSGRSNLHLAKPFERLSIPIHILEEASAALEIESGHTILNAPIVGDLGTWSLTGAGTLEIQSPQTAQSKVHVASGRLMLTSYGSIAEAKSVQVDGDLDVSQIKEQVAYLRNLSGFGSVQIANRNLLIETSMPSQFSGSICGSGGLVKLGSDSLTLHGEQHYTGRTEIVHGTLGLGLSGSIARSQSVVVKGELDISKANGTCNIRNLSGNGTVTLGQNTLCVRQSVKQVFSGAVLGSGNFVKEGSEALILRGKCNYSGDTIVKEGSLVFLEAATLQSPMLVLEGSSSLSVEGIHKALIQIGNIHSDSAETALKLGSKKLVLKGDEDTHFAGKIMGVSSEIFKRGKGRLSLSGHSPFKGILNVEAGVLDFSGSMPASIRVDRNGSLTGSGSSGSVINEGVMAVNGSNGRWRIEGDMLLKKSSQLEIDIHPDGTGDSIYVKDQASIAGSLAVNFSSAGVYFPGLNYSILSAKTITGEFAELVENSEEFDLRISYLKKGERDQVQLTVLKAPQLFKGFSFAPQSEAIADNLTMLTKELDLFSQEEPSAILGLMQHLAILPSAFVGETLEELSPALFGAITEETAQTALTITGTIRGRGAPRCCPNRFKEPSGAFWFEPFVQQYNQPSLGNQVSFDSLAYGGVLGWQAQLGKGHIGLSFAAQYVQLDWNQDRGDANLTCLYPGIYGGYQGSSGYFNAVFLYGFDQITTHRKVHSAQTYTADGTRDGSEYVGSVEGGLYFGTCGAFAPFFSLTYDRLTQKSFTESGADELSLKVDEQNGATLLSELGFAWRPMTQYSWGCMGMEFSGSALLETPLDRQAFHSSFTPYTETFSSNGYDQSQWFGDLGASFFLNKTGFTTRISYEAMFNTALLVQKGSLELKFSY